MQKILSDGLWKELRSQAQGASQRKAAIAYVTQDQLGLKRNDVLVTNASSLAISCGETDAKLLRTLFQKGVRIYGTCTQKLPFSTAKPLSGLATCLSRLPTG